MNKIGIIGFGTVGTVLSNIFNSSGIEFAVYDVLLEEDAHRETLLNKAKQYNAPVAGLPSLIEQSTFEALIV